MKFKVTYKSLVNGEWTDPMSVIIEAHDRDNVCDRFTEVHRACFGVSQKFEILSIDNFSKLTPVAVPGSLFQIVEGEDYKLYFYSEEMVSQLYHVSNGDFNVHVLAPSEKQAISQAACHKDWPEHDANVVRVPFMIRGWSGHTF